jgi:hypothetical protein
MAILADERGILNGVFIHGDVKIPGEQMEARKVFKTR